MNVYLVDYPFISTDALLGIDNLSQEDTVYIFYNSIKSKLSFQAMECIRNSKADIHTVDMGKHFIKNSIAVRLSATLGYFLGKFDNSNIIIITKRKAFLGTDGICAEFEIASSRISICPSLDDAIGTESEDTAEAM